MFTCGADEQIKSNGEQSPTQALIAPLSGLCVFMIRTIGCGNVLIAEYPEGAEKPTFDLDKNGVLWISGYKEKIIPVLPTVGCIKRFDLKLTDSKVIGKYDKLPKKVVKQFSHLLEGKDFDTSRCVVIECPVPF